MTTRDRAVAPPHPQTTRIAGVWVSYDISVVVSALVSSTRDVLFWRLKSNSLSIQHLRSNKQGCYLRQRLNGNRMQRRLALLSSYRTKDKSSRPAVKINVVLSGDRRHEVRLCCARSTVNTKQHDKVSDSGYRAPS